MNTLKRKKLKSVLKIYSQRNLAKLLNCNRPRLNQIANSDNEAYVYFDGDKPHHIEWIKVYKIGGPYSEKRRKTSLPNK